jgi:hypothetical protein
VGRWFHGCDSPLCSWVRGPPSWRAVFGHPGGTRAGSCSWTSDRFARMPMHCSSLTRQIPSAHPRWSIFAVQDEVCLSCGSIRAEVNSSSIVRISPLLGVRSVRPFISAASADRWSGLLARLNPGPERRPPAPTPHPASVVAASVPSTRLTRNGATAPDHGEAAGR